MDLIKKIIIAFIIVIFTYIVWRLMMKRNNILNKINKEPFVEGLCLTGTPQKCELDTLKDSSLTIKIQTTNAVNLSLKQICIKGSYNSAFTGTYINIDMIHYLLSRGCRFFDFEVFYIMDPSTNTYTPQVGYSTDSNITILESENTILLDNVLASFSYGFSNDSPNGGDPIFINLRIKSNNNDVYKSVAKSIDFSLKSLLYKGANGIAVTKDTLVKDLMGKVVIFVDKTINSDYKNLSICDPNSPTYSSCYSLTKYVNAESGGQDFRLNRYANILNQYALGIYILDDDISVNTTSVNLVLPDVIPENAPNPSFMQFITQYGCNIVLYKFYQLDKGLLEYEQMFFNNKYGILPLSTVFIYYKKIQNAT